MGRRGGEREAEDLVDGVDSVDVDDDGYKCKKSLTAEELRQYLKEEDVKKILIALAHAWETGERGTIHVATYNYYHDWYIEIPDE